MRFETFGEKGKPAVLLLHGAGLSWWSYREVAQMLAPDYRVELAVIDGYGDQAGDAFQSIQASAEALLIYIAAEHGGHVFALGGLSLGAQIALEALSRQADVAAYAVLESALAIPMAGARTFFAPMARMSYGLLRKKWFARLQAKAFCLPDALFDEYYRDSLLLSRQTLVNTLVSNGAYSLQPGFAASQAKTLVIVGEKEIGVMRRSADRLKAASPRAELLVARGMKHGEFSLAQPEAYVRTLRAFWQPRGQSGNQPGAR